MSEVIAKIQSYREVPKARIAMWLLIGGEACIFGALILAYVMGRLRYPEWAHQTEHTIPLLGFINTFVLLTSSYWIVVAHDAAHKKDLKKMGWKFVGPTTVYAFMQAMGLINDHVNDCVIRARVTRARKSFKPPK